VADVARHTALILRREQTVTDAEGRFEIVGLNPVDIRCERKRQRSATR
jgi:hypothetical protein